MDGFVLVVVLGVAILGGGALAPWLRLPTPLILLVLGAALGFLPFFSDVALPPELVLLLFLPALLYWESLNTSLREIRRNIEIIVMFAVGLVPITAVLVALIAHAFGLSWPVALVLGAILSPTDATAVASAVGHLHRRFETILRAESLLNDGTALVLYAVAVNAAVSGTPVAIAGTSLRFLGSYGFGFLIGLAVGVAAVRVRQILLRGDRELNGTVSVLTPFVAYLPAEEFGVSGVVAVVTCGLVISHFGPRVITAPMRAQTFGFWQLGTYILNGVLFVLIGLELRPLAIRLGSGWASTLALGVLCAITVIMVRLRRVLIAAKYRPPHADQPTPAEISAFRLAWEIPAA